MSMTPHKKRCDSDTTSGSAVVTIFDRAYAHMHAICHSSRPGLQTSSKSPGRNGELYPAPEQMKEWVHIPALPYEV